MSRQFYIPSQIFLYGLDKTELFIAEIGIRLEVKGTYILCSYSFIPSEFSAACLELVKGCSAVKSFGRFDSDFPI
jgi:hypothetical protein